MGRRGTASHSPMRSRVPARTPPPQPAPPVQSEQPSLLKQMAATAGGVAVGSAIGHAVGHALTGGSVGGNNQPEAVYAQQPPAQVGAENPCQYYVNELIRCSQNQSDLQLCTGFAEALKECRRTHNLT